MNWSDVLAPHFIWIAIGLLLLIGEFLVPGLVIAFFGLGALLVGALCYFVGLSINSQIALFLVSSIAMLLSLRNSLSPLLMGKPGTDHLDDAQDVIGARGQVVEPILHGGVGRIEFHGSQWRAEADEEIPKGANVVVVGRDNLTLRVRSDDRC